MAGGNDDYNLQRNFHSSSRLNAQHLDYTQIQGFLAHPSIPLTPTSSIADVGTGTGVWLLALARRLPETTTLWGFDLDLNQATNPAWLPAKVSMNQWNMFEAVPDKFRGLHDLTHALFFIQVVRKENPGEVLEQLKALTKPGGYVQWTEPDTWSMRLMKASENIESRSSEELCRQLKHFLTQRAGRRAVQKIL